MKRYLQRKQNRVKQPSNGGLVSAASFPRRFQAYLKKTSLLKRATALLLASLICLQLTGTDWIGWLAGQFSAIVQAADFVEPELPACVDGGKAEDEISYDWYQNPSDPRYTGKTGALGSKENPYLIQDGNEMKALSNIVNGTADQIPSDSFQGKYISLKPNSLGTKVVDLINYSGIFYIDGNGRTTFKRARAEGTTDYIGWTPIGVDAAHAFQGTFQAEEGYEIRNLSVNASVYKSSASQVGYTYDAAGLFGYVDFSGGGSLEGIHLTQTQLAGTKNGVSMGALAGKIIGVNAAAPSLVNCSVKGRTGEEYAPFTVSATTQIYVVPAASGVTPNTSIKPDAGNVTSGLVGTIVNAALQDGVSILKNCVVQDTVVKAMAGTASGVIGQADSVSVETCSFSGQVQLSEYTSTGKCSIGGMASVVTNAARFTGCTVNAQIDSLNTSRNEASMGGLIGQAADLTAADCTVTGEITATGTKTDPYNAISTASTGGIAGYVSASARITNCQVGEKGGLFQFNELDAVVNTSALVKVGGIIGFASTFAEIEGCRAYVDLDFPKAQIKASTGCYSYVGGIAGTIGSVYGEGGTVNNCTVEADISGGYATGGIAGRTYGNITASSYSGNLWANIRENKNGAGGIAGTFLGTLISGCTVTANIESPYVNMYSGLGGIAGRAGAWAGSPTVPDIVIQDCIYNGSITAADRAYQGQIGVGGIAGCAKNTTVLRCVSSAAISWTSCLDSSSGESIGGIIGRMETSSSSVQESLSAGTIEVTSEVDVECHVGGLVGFLQGAIQDSYSTVSLQSDNILHNVGGLAGQRSGNGSLKTSYFAGTILSPWGGSLAGYFNSDSITNTFYNKKLSPNAFAAYSSFAKDSLLRTGIASDSDKYLDKDKEAARTTAELTDGTLPSGFSDTTWTASAGSYPRLAWMTAGSAAVKRYAELTASPILTFENNDDYSLHLTSPVNLPAAGDANEWRAPDGILISNGSYSPAENTVVTNSITFQEKEKQWTLSQRAKLLLAPADIPGLGQRSSPFELSTKDQLLSFAEYVNAGGGYLGAITEQKADIDLGGVSLSPIGTKASPYCGRLVAGIGKTAYKKISNYTLQGPAEGETDPMGGLFGYCLYGAFSGVSLEGSIIDASSPYSGKGTLAGYTRNMQLFACSSVGADITVVSSGSAGGYSGGLIGWADRTTELKYCWFAGDVKGADCFGGLVGKLSDNSRINTSYVSGNIGDSGFSLEESRDNLGGLVGTALGSSISQSYFIGNLIGRNALGGLVGSTSSSASLDMLKTCYFVGTINGNDRVGGLIGDSISQTKITDSYFIGQITSAGLAGAISSTVATLKNTYYNKEITSSLKALGSADDEGAGKTSAELSGAGLTFSSTAFTKGSDTAPHYPSLSGVIKSGPGDPAAQYKTEMQAASAASTASLYDFFSAQAGHENNNAYIVKSSFSTTKRDNVSIEEPYNIDQGFTTESTADGINTYIPTASPKASLYPFFATYSGLPYPDLTIRTKVIVVPFKTGSGTEQDPFEIPDVETLIAFRDYINQGSGAHAAYYKLTAPDDNPVYDLSKIQWVPVGGVMPQSVLNDTVNYPYYERASVFNGHFDGNNRTIQGLRIGSEESPADYTGTINLTAGLFGNIKSGSIRNFTLDDAKMYLRTDSDGFYAGPVAGVFDSSLATDQPASSPGAQTQMGILVTNAVLSAESSFVPSPGHEQQQDVSLGGAFGQIKTSGDIQNMMADSSISYKESISAATPADVKVGGITGKADCDAGSITLDEVVARTDITGPGLSGYAGGLIGQAAATNGETTHIEIKNSASYGSLSGYLQIGGAVGRLEGGIGKTTGQKNPITNFVSTADILVPANGFAGGIYGYAEQINMSNCVYGGRVQAESVSDNTLVGGLIGQFCFDANDVLASEFSSCFYDASLNSGLSVPPGSQKLIKRQYGLGYWKVKDGAYVKDDQSKSMLASLQSSGTAKHTFELTAGTEADAAWTDTFLSVKGLYPYPVFAGKDTTPDPLENLTVANSVAVYYVWAANNPGGVEQKQLLSSAYVLYDAAGLDTISDGRVAVTEGRKRVVATRKETEKITAQVEAAVNQQTTRGKKISFIPDNTPTGKPDISYLVANPNGDGRHASDTGSGEKEVSFTLYNADQLAGLALLAEKQGQGDGTLLDDHFNYYQGSMSVLDFAGRSVYLGTDLDCSVYTSWTPIGSGADKPFRGSFDGQGHSVSGLQLTGAQENQGLFGYVTGTGEASAVLSGTAVVGGTISNSTATNLGSLLGCGGTNVIIQGCFSSVRVESSRALGTTYVGGLAGSLSDGSNLIDSSFFTGSVYANPENPDAYAGGFAGNGGYLLITQSYVAGFADAAGGHFGAFTGRADAVRFANAYMDVNACGQINADGTATGTALTIATANLKVSQDGQKPSQLTGFDADKWTYAAGLYPMIKGFSLPQNNISVIPVTLEAHGRSTTYGHVEYPGALLTAGEGQEGKYSLTDGFSFTKVNSGVTFVNLTFGGQTRIVYMDLKCWYEEPVDGVYTISNAYELQELAYIVNDQLDKITHTHAEKNKKYDFAGETIRLAYDIDLSALNNYVPAGTAENPFRGTFDGQGHIISGISLSTDSLTEIGLFGVTDNAVIQNVGLSGGRIEYTGSGNPSLGGIVGLAQNTRIDTCFNGAEIQFSGEGATVGGIAGSISGSQPLNGCFNMALINYTGTGAAAVGGIAGSNASPVQNSYNTGMLRADESADALLGGISGGNTSAVQNCYNAALLLMQVGVTDKIAPIAQGEGETKNCAFDQQFSAGTAKAPQVSFVNSSELCASSLFQDGWVVKPGLGFYPQLAAFVSGSEGQQAASLVSSEAALLKKAAGSPTYKDFESIVMNAEGPLAGGTQTIQVDKKADTSGGTFEITTNGGRYTLLPADEGPTTIMVSMEVDGKVYQRELLFQVIQMLNVRYQYDFSGIEDWEDNGHSGVGTQTESTWMAAGKGEGTAGDPYQISTPEDLLAFSEAVKNNALSASVYVTLMAPIDLDGKTLSPIGTADHPFNGTFDGNGYVIKNMVQTGGTTGLFGYVGQQGKIKRVGLENAKVTLSGQAGSQTGGILAASNSGLIQSCYVRGEFTVRTPGSPSAQTFAGTLAGINNGRITGCYFRPMGSVQSSAVQSYISRSVENLTNFGILVGLNAGTMSGCYHTSDMLTANNCIDAYGIAGYSSSDGVLNCYYDTFNGQVVYPIAFEGPDGAVSSEPANSEEPYSGYKLDTARMKSPETALQLSFDLYLATLQITAENDGYPSLDAFELINMDFHPFADDHTILFNLQNNLQGEVSTVMNAVGAYDGYNFPRFGKIPVNGQIVINLPDLPKQMVFQVEASAYGYDESGKKQIKELKVDNNGQNRLQKTISTVAGSESGSMPDKAYQINITIKLSGGVAQDPWGVRQKWSSVTMTTS